MDGKVYSALEGDASQALAVLEWARTNGVAVAAVTCGGCTVTLFEPRGGADDKRDQRARGGMGIYESLGGEVWKHAVQSGDIEGAGHGSASGDDLEPSIGAGE
jgi:hypothetical protein